MEIPLDPGSPGIWSPAGAARSLDGEGGTYLRLRAGASGDLALYRPHGVDPQTPHQRDEAYVVATGRAIFVRDGEGGSSSARAVAAGDLIFVPAGEGHRFIDFSEDFATWVIFFGAAPTGPASPDPASSDLELSPPAPGQRAV